jgi:hypothetical protein
MLSGTNEILLGDVPFCHFAAIQEGFAQSPKAMSKFDFQLAPIPEEIDDREPAAAIKPPKHYESPISDMDRQGLIRSVVIFVTVTFRVLLSSFWSPSC